MARGRMISKTLSTSEKRASLHLSVPDLAEFCQQLYPLLIAHADDFGRLQGDVFTVKHLIDPTSPRLLPDFQRALQALNDVELIAWYEVEGRRYIQIVQFDPHQVGLHKRTTSGFPAPVNGLPGNFPENPSELKGREPKGTEQKKNVSSEPAGSEPSSPVVLEFPTTGPEGPVYQLSATQIGEWRGFFPTIDVLAEAKQALAWILANPGRKKTVRGMPRFLVSWFTRTVNSGGGQRPSASVRPDSPSSQSRMDTLLGNSRRPT